MHLLAFAASNSSQSINRRLVTFAAERFAAHIRPGTTLDLPDIHDFEMPIYQMDREKTDGVPPLAQAFLDKVRHADGVLISFAEHNGSYSVAYKNLFDWMSRIDSKVYKDKPMVLLATSPGGSGARSVLQSAVHSAPFFGAEVCGSLSVPRFGEAFDAQAGTLSDPELLAELDTILEALAENVSPPATAG